MRERTKLRLAMGILLVAVLSWSLVWAMDARHSYHGDREYWKSVYQESGQSGEPGCSCGED